MLFDWDAVNRAHIERHAVSREEVEQVLAGEPLEYPAYSKGGERRYGFVGPTRSGRMLFVVVTRRRNAVRPVTAFPASQVMRKLYDEYVRG